MAGGGVFGLAAHVDAGKTTLSEAMLFLSGAVRRQGRVDHGDAFLDTEAMEKERGVTIFSKQAVLTWKKKEITLVDTPGHSDFSGETERVLDALDLCVLVISAADGVQPHTRTLWRLMEQRKLPVVLFVNKMDRFSGDREALLSGLSARLSDRVVDFTGPDEEKIALCDESCLDVYLREGAVPPRMIRALVRDRKLFPCFFGAALRNEGVEPLLDFLAETAPVRPPRVDFGALVYKVARDPQGARLAFLRVTGGVLNVRDTLTLRDEQGEPVWAEKAAEIRQYSGSRYTPLQRAEAGQVCCVVGLSRALPGDGLGAQAGGRESQLQPVYTCRVLLPPGSDAHYALNCLQALEEEEPLLQVEYVEAKREIRVHSMGDMYLEVLRRQLKDRFGLDAEFSETGVLYRETIAAPVEGVGHYEPLRHYAEVHLWLSPLPAGSGLQFDSDLSTDVLALNWQRLILTHLKERTHPGVLTGSPITDMRLTLIHGKAHLKHTEGGDFRQATYRAVRQGLMKAQSVLLEPYLSLEITVPEAFVGRVMSDLAMMGGAPSAPEDAGDGLRRLTAAVPAAKCASYGRQVSVFTKGQGRMAADFAGYRPCADAESVVARIGYSAEADTFNPADSVFCAHGAGYNVNWREVDAMAHLPLRKDRQEVPDDSAPARVSRSSGYGGTAEEDRELQAIFERTYGPAKARSLFSPVQTAKADAPAPADVPVPRQEILLVDGYNVLFAWDETKALAAEDIGLARQRLTDLLCNFSGVTGKKVILVFDAYRVQGGPGSVEKHANIFIVYTRESQTADAYIEKTTYEAKDALPVRVVTSDGPEQLIALGNRALRTSAREFHREVTQAQGSIRAFLDALAKNRSPVSAVEKAYKDAWKQKKQEEKQKEEGTKRG